MAFHDLKKLFSLFFKKSSSGIFFIISYEQVLCDLYPIGSVGTGYGSLWEPDEVSVRPIPSRLSSGPNVYNDNKCLM